MKRQSPLAPLDRSALILSAALRLAHTKRYDRLTRAEIAHAAGVACGTVSYSCGTMAAVQDAVVRLAIATEAVAVLADAIALRDPIARTAPEALRQAALAHIAQ